MRDVRVIAAKLEGRSAWFVSRLRPLAALPARLRALLLQGAVAVLLLALGVVINKEIAWVLVGVAVTVIVLLALAGFLFGGEGAGDAEPPSHRSRHRTGRGASLTTGERERITQDIARSATEQATDAMLRKADEANRSRRAEANRIHPEPSTVRRLRSAQSQGRRLHAEAGELDPVGNLPLVEDLVRRYNDWEGEVADTLADGNAPTRWRQDWLTDPEWHSREVFPITREQLDAMARMIGRRLRLLEAIGGEPWPARPERSSVADLKPKLEREARRGRLLLREMNAVGVLRLTDQLRECNNWIDRVEALLTDRPKLLRSFRKTDRSLAGSHVKMGDQLGTAMAWFDEYVANLETILSDL